MANDDIIDPRRLDNYFWLRAETGDVTITKTGQSLSELIEEHPAFKTGKNTDPYFNQDDFNAPEKWNIPFWPQKPSLILNNRDELESLIHALSVGWSGYEKTLPFHGAAIQLDHQNHISRLKLTFNGESQRVYDDFSDYMSPRMQSVGFSTISENQFSPYISLAKKRDTEKQSQARESLSGTIDRRFSELKTEKVTVKSMVLGQVLRSSSDYSKGRRDIARIHSNGHIEWLFNGNPFDNRENYKLVNPDKKLAPA